MTTIEDENEDEGYDPMTDPDWCSECQGEGRVPTDDHESYFGAMYKPCPSCRRNPCTGPTAAVMKPLALKIEVVGTISTRVRVTHIPTGLIAECDNGRSQGKSKRIAESMIEWGLVEMGWKE